MQPDSPTPPGERPDEGNIVQPGVFAERRALQTDGEEGLLARATAAERAVVSLEGRIQEIRHELNETATQRDRLAAELSSREIDLRAAAQRDRSALQDELANARSLVADSERRVQSERARANLLERGDSDREERLRRAEAEIEIRSAALRASEIEAEGVRAALDARRDGLEARLREVDHALVDLAARLTQEQIARETAEAAFESERAAREHQVGMLRSELDQRSARVEGVQREVGDLRRELVGVLGGAAPDKQGAQARIKEIKRDLLALGERALTLERERDEAVAGLATATGALQTRAGEIERLRSEMSAATEQLEAARSELAETRVALEDAQRTSREEMEARERIEQDLAAERDLFRQQLEIADGQLRAEIQLQRKAFEEHTHAVERSIAELHARLAEARSQMAERVGAERAARLAAEEKLEQLTMEAVAASITAPSFAPGLVRPAGEPQEATGALAADIDSAAQRLRETKAIAEEMVQAAEEAVQAVEPVAEPAPDRDPLPQRELPAEPVGPWLLSAFQALGEEDPDTAARTFVEMLPATASDLPKDTVIDFALDELGAYRLTVHLGTGSVGPWRAGSSRQADLALAGSAIALAPIVAGNAQRKLKGVDHSGRKKVLRKLLKARKEPVMLADLHQARVTPGLGGLLALLAAGVDKDWIGDRELVVGFEATGPGHGSWVVRSSAEGLSVKPGRAEADAVVVVPSPGVLPLLMGTDPPVAGRPMVSGDAEAANAVLSWLDRAQRK